MSFDGTPPPYVGGYTYLEAASVSRNEWGRGSRCGRAVTLDFLEDISHQPANAQAADQLAIALMFDDGKTFQAVFANSA